MKKSVILCADECQLDKRKGRYKINYGISPKTLRSREVKGLTQGHTACGWTVETKEPTNASSSALRPSGNPLPKYPRPPLVSPHHLVLPGTSLAHTALHSRKQCHPCLQTRNRGTAQLAESSQADAKPPLLTTHYSGEQLRQVKLTDFTKHLHTHCYPVEVSQASVLSPLSSSRTWRQRVSALLSSLSSRCRSETQVCLAPTLILPPHSPCRQGRMGVTG